MSGLETLGLVCNVLQVISFARETISLCVAIYDGKNPDDHLKENAEQASALSADVEKYYASAKTSPTPHEKRLAEVAHKCNIAARALEEEVLFLTGSQAKGNLAATIKTPVKTNWRKKRLRRLELSLQSCRDTMESHILVHMSTQVETIMQSGSQNFQHLRQDVQFFLSEYVRGQRSLCDLVNTSHAITNQHTTMETTRAQDLITRHITKELISFDASIKEQIMTHVAGAAGEIVQNTKTLSIQTRSSDQRGQILKSLKFPGLNERWNHITDFHEKTFEWILKPEKESISSNDSVSNEDSSVISDGESETSQESLDTRAIKDRMGKHKEGEVNHLWDDFSDWLRSDSKVYWICGKPGSGKSTLMKYLCCNPLTKDHLNVWNASAVILGHFLWKPGSILQRSMKGLLCTLIHQALSKNPAMLDDISSRFPSVSLKDYHTDWSAKELKTICRWVFNAYPSALCIFLDGLDEICPEDGAKALLQLIEDLKAMSNVKVCVASRPESRFQRTLCMEQHLELQYLTATDMERYSKDMLTQPMERYGISKVALAKTVHDLVNKADGVFLWLRLAVRSLINGLENDDSEADLAQRLDSLPTELSDLYSDIWARLNEDTVFYRQSAAIYFNLIIRARSIHDKFSTFGLIRAPFAAGTASVFHLMAATNTTVQTCYLSDQMSLQERSLDEMCSKTCTDIRTRCAGMVEISSQGDQTQYFKFWNEEARGILLPHANSVVRFIHRSAYDFFTEEQEGCRIRAYDCTSQDKQCLQLLKGMLVCAKIYRTITDMNEALSVLVPLSWISDPTLEDQVGSLLQICAKWYQHRYLTYDRRPDHMPNPQFLAVAAIPRLKKFVLSSIRQRKNSSLLATLVLRDLFGLPFSGLTPILWAAYFLKALLSLGADPNLQGITPVEYPISDKVDASAMPFRSAFGGFLAYSIMISFGWQVETRETKICDILEQFLNEKADLRLRIPLGVSLDAFRTSVMRISHLNPHISPHLSDESGPVLRIGFVLDVTAAFCVQVLCHRYIHQDDRLSSILTCVEAAAASPSFPSDSIACFGNSKIKLCRPLETDRTNSLLRLTKNCILAGHNIPSNELRKEANKVVEDIQNGVQGYEKLEGDFTTHLAKTNCGYCLSEVVESTT